MKILICGDVHFSQYSSILRRRGERYSYRLENLIDSIDWVEELANEERCNEIVYLGDFFDKAELNAEEISALSEISWYEGISHTFLVGNHEAGRATLEYSSAHLFHMQDYSAVISHPVQEIRDGICFLYLPYILECDRKASIKDYMNQVDDYDKWIVFSHNDIKDFQMGQFISKEGFSIDDIEANCDLYFNGHLHNGGKVTDKIINVGNLTGQNFSEDAFKYDHSVIILDTDTMTKAVYQNPYALNFYKLDFTSKHDIDYINEISMKMGHNCVATIKCLDSDYDYLRARFDLNHRKDNIPYNCNMVETRFIIQNTLQGNAETINNEEIISVDHLVKFKEYMVELLGNSDVLEQELYEVCK